MKSLRRIGCWTTFILIFAFGTFVFLFTQSRQGRNEFNVSFEQRNVTLFGGDVQIGEHEHIIGNLLVVGDDLTLEGRVGGNLVVIGGDADLTGHAQVGGNVSVVGGDAEVEDSSVVGGNVAVVGGDVALAGHSRVGGNVRVVGGRIEQEPDAHVAGGTSWRIYANGAAQPNLPSAATAQLALVDPPKQPDPPNPPVVEAGGSGEDVRARSRRLQRAVEELEEAAEEAAEAAEEAAEAAEEAAEELAEAAEDAAEAAEEAAEELAEAAEDAAEAAAEAAEDAAEAAREQAELQREVALEAAAAARANANSSQATWFLVFLGKLVRAFLWTLLITGLVLLFAWLLPKQVKAISGTAEKETALSFATGAIGIMGSGLLAAILTITVCFALLALPLLALLALVLLCGWTVTCYWLGRRLDELVAGPGSSSWNPLISVGISSLVVTGVTAFAWVIFPCLGFIVALLIGSTGTGAVIVHVARGSGRLPNGVLGGRQDDPGPDGVEASQSGIDEPESTAETAETPVTELPVLLADASGSPDREVAESSPVPSSPAGRREEHTDLTLEAPPEDKESDDLTRIMGIGPTYAERLRDAGITTFSQLAALDAEEIAAVLGCPAARVERERLREQAGELAGL